MKTNSDNGSLVKKIKLTGVLLLLSFLFTSCGMHHNIKGKVVDVHTGQPVEGAVVAINWIRYKLGPPGYPTPKEYYGTTEKITDTLGGFTIPYYPFGTHFMGVYKKGYVCWSSDTLFNPQGKDEDEMYVRRREKVKSGMVVMLDPKTEDFPELKHARFVQRVGTRIKWPTPFFIEATKEEYKIYMDDIKHQMSGKKQ